MDVKKWNYLILTYLSGELQQPVQALRTFSSYYFFLLFFCYYLRLVLCASKAYVQLPPRALMRPADATMRKPVISAAFFSAV